MAIVEDQMVEVKWNGRNKRHYTEKGYIFTKLGDPFFVSPNDLTHGSDCPVEVMCDYCHKNKHILYNQYYEQVVKVNRNEYACKNCASVYSALKKNENAFKNYIECNENKFENIIYTLNYEQIKKLNTQQKMLINNVKRFCELNQRFPSEKDMTIKNGYISRTQFYKYFNTKTFIDIYQYIYPLKRRTKNQEITKLQKQISKPALFKCSKCNVVKDFNKDNFPEGKYNKYGLKTVCRKCENEYTLKLRYKVKGIIFETFEDISPEIWWTYLYEEKIGYLPDFCLTEENIIKIFRFVFLDKLGYSKNEIVNLEYFNQSVMKKHKVYHLYQRYSNKHKFLQMCFPEMNIKAYELPVTYYSEEVMIETINDWITLNNLTIDDILNHNYITDRNSTVGLMAARKFTFSDPQMFTWYFYKQNILHPLTNAQIDTSDFKYKSNNYWREKENRIKAVKNYCESNNIQDVMYNTDDLKGWVKNYYKQNDINSIYEYIKFHPNAYESLVEAYPHIKEQKILFSWEWHQVNINTKDGLIKALREMILYREHLKSPKEISSFLRHQTLVEKGHTKFVKHVQRKRFNTFYEWACLSFPEYKNQWTIEDFGGFYAKDGTVCDSLEEVKIYEFIKYQLEMNVEAIGTTFTGEHIFKLPFNHVDEWYCPDFIIRNDTDIIYVEYFGLYSDQYANNKFLTKYREKTHRKIKYYDSTGLQFVYLYRPDIKNDFLGVREKLLKAIPPSIIS